MGIFLDQKIIDYILTYDEENEITCFTGGFLDELKEYLGFSFVEENKYHLCNCHLEQKEDEFLSNIVLHNSPAIEKNINDFNIPFVLMHCLECGASNKIHLETLILNIDMFFMDKFSKDTTFTEEQVFHINCPTEVFTENINRIHEVSNGDNEKFNELFKELIQKYQHKADIVEIPKNTNPVIKQEKQAQIIPFNKSET